MGLRSFPTSVADEARFAGYREWVEAQVRAAPPRFDRGDD